MKNECGVKVISSYLTTYEKLWKRLKPEIHDTFIYSRKGIQIVIISNKVKQTFYSRWIILKIGFLLAVSPHGPVSHS